MIGAPAGWRTLPPPFAHAGQCRILAAPSREKQDDRMTVTDKIIASTEAGVATLTFNNPERHNAVSLEMWQAVASALERFSADPAVRVLVLRGAGGKAFVSGADISKFESERASEGAVAAYEQATDAAYAAVANFGRPSIALIQGYCLGGGVNLALCCDLRICNEAARFAVPAARLGLGYGLGSVRRVVNLIGPAFAKEVLFTARQFSAAEASAMGLVNRVLANDAIEDFVADYARTIAGNAPLTVTALKRIVDEAVKDAEERDEDLCARLVKACFDSDDYREGRRAFLEKRKPDFTGH
jgi:enoyl-CoA hydratase/carnithine racemase